MIRVFTISSLLPLLLFGYLSAQNTYQQWFFGKNAGLSFQTNSVHALVTGNLNTTEGCATISDSTGHLMFYTNGVKVWNKNHNLMFNGSGLFGDVSATQSAAIVPHPTQTNIYYIVTTGEWSENVGLRFSIVDMNQDFGRGAITQKNIGLTSNASERLTVISHANKRDYWLLSHRINTNEFMAFLVNPIGIQTTPVSSFVGSVDSSAVGYLKASLDGKKLAMAFRNKDFYEIYDFNPATGQVANPITFPPIYHQSYGCEFSPDGSRLYIHSSKLEQSSQPSKLFQVDLTGSTAGDIISSVISIANIGVQHPGAMQLGPDGRIYIARHNALYLGVISDPNALGTACNYIDEGFYLGGRNCQFGLNNAIPRKVLPAPQLLVTTACAGDSTFLFAKNRIAIDSVIWHLGDPGTNLNILAGKEVNHIYKQAGTYQVKMVYYRGRLTDTLSQLIQILPKPYINLGTDTAVCPGEILELNAIHPSTNTLTTTFLWQDNSGTPVHTAKTEGWYWVEAQNVCGTYRDSLEFTFRDLPQAQLGTDTLLCEGQILTLKAEVAAPATFLWDNGQNTPLRNIDKTGTYWVYVEDACGNDTDSIDVVFEQKPTFDLGQDTLICEGEELSLNAQPLQGISYSYLWNDGDTSPTRTVDKAGKYSVKLQSRACYAKDSIQVRVRLNPYVDFGPDTTICINSPLLLRASGDAATYTWQDGSTGPQYLVQQSGVYWVEVNNSCGTATDEIKVTTHRRPKVNLGSDTSICTYHPLLLDASSSAGGITYQWENGSSFPYRKIAKTGSYAVSLTNSCGTVSDTLEVTASLEACDCKIFIPNVITPNFDGVNDQFTISYPCEFKHFQLQIFDRWGQQIFASEDPENCWDGSAKHNCPNGTYYYVISYQGKDSYLSQEERKLNTVKGVVTLIR